MSAFAKPDRCEVPGCVGLPLLRRGNGPWTCGEHYRQPAAAQAPKRKPEARKTALGKAPAPAPDFFGGAA